MTDTKKSGFFKSLFGGRKTHDRGIVPLHIPLTLKMEKDLEQNIEATWNQVLQQRLGPLLLLHAANRYLEKINPLPMSYEQRARISNILLNEVVAAVGSQFFRFFQQGGGIPETREQRDTISQAVRAVEQLAINYKLLFRRDWADPDQSHTTQERTLVVALRILECVRLEQLLLAFRYQKLPKHAWRDINQIFFALRGDWDVKAKYPLKVQWAVDDSVSSMALFPKTASLEQMYLAIQLTGLLDVISWPVHLAYRVGRYLSAIEEPFIKDDESIDNIPAGHCIVYHDQAVPPRFNRNPDQMGPSLLLDLNPILRQAIQDRSTLMSPEKTSTASAILLEIPERDRITFLDLLLHRVQPQQRHESRQRIFNTRHARVYGGFNVVYRLYIDIHRKDGDRETVTEDRRFWDTLAEHINIVAENEEGGSEPRWVIADEGSGGIQLHVQEGEYSRPIYVGRLVAYNSGEDELSASRLGYVVRLQRIGDDEVEVAIADIRGEVQPVMVEDQDGAEGRPLPALLIRAEGGKLQLLCDNKHSLITGGRVAVAYDGHHHSGALGKVIIAQTDFSVFALHPSE
jgi:hypothetical protein